MANVLILGGGFGGVIAAERLAQTLAPEHQISLISRADQFIFYPALVRLAFGKCTPDDISFDLRKAMLDRRIRFIRAEVARVDPDERTVTTAHGEVGGKLNYDYLIFALGRRLATERVTGFYEHADHLLTVEAALKFGAHIEAFKQGRAVIGACPGARLPVPIYETAFALARHLKERNLHQETRITIVTPDAPDGDRLGGVHAKGLTRALRDALDRHDIEFLPGFSVARVNEGHMRSDDGASLSCELLMLVPPFAGAPAVLHTGITDSEGFICTDRTMRVRYTEHMYAVGDCVSFSGPKLGHMAVRQGEVAAANVQAEIDGREPVMRYDHEVMLVIDESGGGSTYVHQDLWSSGEGSVRQGRFWSWAKRVQEIYFQARHS